MRGGVGVVNLALEDDPDFQDIIDAFLKKIHDGDLKDGQLDEAMAAAIAEQLTDAMIGGMGAAGMEETKLKLYDVMQQNIYQFSAAKTFTEATYFRDLLFDEQKELKSFSQFRKDADSANKLFNEDWLQAEYNTSTASGQAAAKWQDFERDKEIYPILEKVVIEDERTCPICGPLNGLKAPIDDAVWDTIGGPLHFNCRCTELQVVDGSAATAEGERSEQVKTSGKYMQPLFKNNVGKTGIVFTKEHPYFNDPDYKAWAKKQK